MHKEKFQFLINKYLRGECTEEEKQELLHYYESFDREPDLTAGLTGRERMQLKTSMYRSIRQKAFVEQTKTRSLQARVVWSVAVVVIMILAWYVIFQHQDRVIEYQTAFGETRTWTLPDQSVVTLNGHSSIRFEDGWKKESSREVWADGEVYFDVQHTADHQPFIVHLEEQFQVEVLGTQFSVFNRSSGTHVALKSGRVEVQLSAPLEGESQDERVSLVPGELAKLSKKRHLAVGKIVNSQRYFGWLGRRYGLDETTLKDMLIMLEETYGFRFTIKNGVALDRKRSGSIPLSDNQENMLENISLLYEVPIVKKDQVYIVGS